MPGYSIPRLLDHANACAQSVTWPASAYAFSHANKEDQFERHHELLWSHLLICTNTRSIDESVKIGRLANTYNGGMYVIDAIEDGAT